MIYFILVLILVGALIFLFYPFINGSIETIVPPWQESGEKGKRYDQIEELADRMESTKLALRDLDMENKIGKISSGDFEILKAELLEEWVEAKHEYEALAGKSQTPETSHEK